MPADFQMSYLEHADIREITEKLQIAESTVKHNAKRAKQYLRKRLKNLYTFSYFPIFRIKDQPTERKNIDHDRF